MIKNNIFLQKNENTFSGRYAVPEDFKDRILTWADTFDTVIYLDHNNYPTTRNDLHSWDVLVAVGCQDTVEVPVGDAFEAFEAFYTRNKGQWMFGYLAYDLKNELEALASHNHDGVNWPDLFFFVPQIIIGIKDKEAYLFSTETDTFPILGKILNTPPSQTYTPSTSIPLTPRISKADYLERVAAIRQHIAEGDIYEMNFCQEFYAEQITLNPIGTFKRLNNLSAAPFATYLKRHHRHLLCASPERFLRKDGPVLTTQPIKGTRRRSADPEEDAQIKAELTSSEKDRSENVMIVDLVRNDLAHSCLPGSIKVEELFGIYTFPTVHQMISTVKGALPEGDSGLAGLRAAFPMGSMTGAPKVMAMKLIEHYETTRRGMFSGAVGYIDPNGDFDFNVVIRSLQYEEESGYLSCSVGGAIVYESDPEQEYEECLVKLQAIQNALKA